MLQYREGYNVRSPEIARWRTVAAALLDMHFALFSWPLQMGPMVYIGCLALAAGVVAWLPGLARLLFLVIWLMFFRYAMTVLVLTARGNFNPDQASMHVEGGDHRPLKQVLFIFITIMVGVFIALRISPKLALLYALLATLSLPAAIMIIAIEDSLLQALNPMRLFSVMGSIGWPYLLLVLFLLLLQGGDAAVLRVVGPAIPNFIKIPLVMFASMYFLLVMYNMMGYVVYQYHEALGYSVDKSFEEHHEEKTADPNMSPVDRAVAQQVAAGDVQGAITTHLDDMRYEQNDLVKNQKLHKLYLMLGENDKTLPHAKHLLGLLVAEGRADVAYELLVKMKGLAPEFASAEPATVLPLAEIAKRRNNAALALEMLNAFIKQHPKHADVPAVYLLAAKVIAEHKRDDAQAMRILNALMSNFPDSASAVEAKTYLAVLERTSAAAVAPTAAAPAKP
jgi:hypothetical protein